MFDTIRSKEKQEVRSIKRSKGDGEILISSSHCFFSLSSFTFYPLAGVKQDKSPDHYPGCQDRILWHVQGFAWRNLMGYGPVKKNGP